jgi:hypothetical protein
LDHAGAGGIPEDGSLEGRRDEEEGGVLAARAGGSGCGEIEPAQMEHQAGCDGQRRLARSLAVSHSTADRQRQASTKKEHAIRSTLKRGR